MSIDHNKTDTKYLKQVFMVCMFCSRNAFNKSLFLLKIDLPSLSSCLKASLCFVSLSPGQQFFHWDVKNQIKQEQRLAFQQEEDKSM